MKRQLTGIRGDSPLQSAIRAGNLELVREIISQSPEGELKELLSKRNNSCETALYVAADNGHLDIVKELIRYHDVGLAGFKARNGFDAFHIAAKNGHLGKSLNDLKWVGVDPNYWLLLCWFTWHCYTSTRLGCFLNPFEHTRTVAVI